MASKIEAAQALDMTEIEIHRAIFADTTVSEYCGPRDAFTDAALRAMVDYSQTDYCHYSHELSEWIWNAYESTLHDKCP